jgi:hypothetical protein
MATTNAHFNICIIVIAYDILIFFICNKQNSIIKMIKITVGTINESFSCFLLIRM